MVAFDIRQDFGIRMLKRLLVRRDLVIHHNPRAGSPRMVRTHAAGDIQSEEFEKRSMISIVFAEPRGLADHETDLGLSKKEDLHMRKAVAPRTVSLANRQV
jgi:hypothetical protein